MLRKTLYTVSLLYLWPCCVVACRAQENSAAVPSLSAKLTAMQEENLALDFALNNLRNHVSLSASLSQTPISLLREKKVLFGLKLPIPHKCTISPTCYHLLLVKCFSGEKGLFNKRAIPEQVQKCLKTADSGV